MPKTRRFSSGSIIFFQGDLDESIYILQSGAVALQSLDVESGMQVIENLHPGEFFGVKNALAHKPSLVTASVVSESIVVQMTVPEFEKIFGGKQAITEKMLRVFSRSLRDTHKKTESILKGGSSLVPPKKGMFMVANAFFNDGQFISCVDILNKLQKMGLSDEEQKSVTKLLEEAKGGVVTQRRAFSTGKEDRSYETMEFSQFSLPVFDRFTRNFKQGEVIISEYEPGETFYLIKTGEVLITKCINEHNKTLDIMKSGAFFGEMAILDNSQRSASCVARTDVSCLEFNKENFKSLVISNPQIMMNLLKLFCKRIYDQNRQLKILMISDIPVRIADVFLMHEELSGNSREPAMAETGKRKYTMKPNDLASWAGLPSDRAEEEISKFERMGKITFINDGVIVSNIHDMRRIVDNYYTKLKANEKNK